MCVCVCVCVYVCLCLCNHSTGRNFYPIDTKFGTQVGNMNSKIEFEDDYVGSIGTPRDTTKKYIQLLFNHKSNF